MNLSVAAILFDLDGTLVDTAPDFIRVLNQVRQEEGLTPLPHALIRDQVSNGARALIRLGFNIEEGDSQHCRLLNRLLKLYSEGLAQESCLFADLGDFLDALDARRIPWGVVTNKPSIYTFPLLQQLGLLARCGAVICPDHVTHKKPHAEPTLKACEQIGVDPTKSWYVGDHVRDIESGRNAGCKTIAAAWGYLSADENINGWQPDFIFNTPRAMSDFFWETEKIPKNTLGTLE